MLQTQTVNGDTLELLKSLLSHTTQKAFLLRGFTSSNKILKFATAVCHN